MMESVATPHQPSPTAVADAPAVPPHARKRRALGGGFLVTGFAALLVNELIFAFLPGMWIILLAGGLLLVALGWLMLAVLGWRSALVATAVVTLSGFALWAAAPALHAQSWRMLVWSHRDALASVVTILEPVRMTDEARRIDARCTRLPGVSGGDCATLRAALRDVGAHGTWKAGAVTVLETYSTFNARGGLLHCTRDCTPPPPRPYSVYWKRVEGDWYRWAE